MKRVLISRVDKIGDVVLTLPLAGAIKLLCPECEIVFLGQSYTREIIESSRFVDRFLEWHELRAKSHREQIQILQELDVDAVIHVLPQKYIARLTRAARIPIRVGTSRRWFHWFTCNRLVPLSRRNSGLHEAQLNLKLMSGLGLKGDWALDEIKSLFGLQPQSPPDKISNAALPPKSDVFRLVLHPRSRGSAREWPLEYFADLINLLDPKDFEVLVTGTKAELHDIDQLLKLCNPKLKVHNLCGKLSVSGLIREIAGSDGFVGASTGPLHIAAALGVRTVGLYPSISPMDASRWGPLGDRASYLCSREPGSCDGCRHSTNCKCMREIDPAQVLRVVEKWRVNQNM